MTNPGPAFRPYEKLVRIMVHDREFEVPENNAMLRALQYIAPERIAYGRFCWNEECQECRIRYDTGEGTRVNTALACKLVVQDGMRIVELSRELRFCLRELGIKFPPLAPLQQPQEESM